MKRLYCDSDIGSCLIGNKDWNLAIPNCYGDGLTIIQIFDDKDEDFDEYEKANNLEYVASAQGTFNIYNYDCAFVKGCRNEDVIATLSGEYCIYQGEQIIAFVKTDED